MKKFTKAALATTLLFTGLNTAMAESSEKEIDPSDLTKVNTTAAFNLDNKGGTKLIGSLAFGYDNGQMAAFSLEGSLSPEGHYDNSRLQYFHVFNVGNPIMPRAAASIDIIDNQMFTTAAVGGLAMFIPNIPKVTFFARGAVLAGEYKDEHVSQFNETDTDILGGMGAFYAMWTPGADGTYFYVSPEYTYMGGDVETSVAKVTLFASTPLSADRTRWGQLKLETTDTTSKNSLGITDDRYSGTDTKVTIGYKAYF